jgi:hypothetical protein
MLKIRKKKWKKLESNLKDKLDCFYFLNVSERTIVQSTTIEFGL